MHEMGITQGILAASIEAAEKAGAERITEIRISVGELTEVVEFALQFAFEALTPGTMAEGATLVVTHVTARSRCETCKTEYEHDRFTMVCPECGSFHVTLLQGRELEVDAIETDDHEDTDGGEASSPTDETRADEETDS
jgi:hydrogenase nickel incorporation protein HypA/HybF